MIVVADTGPLIYLNLVGAVELLEPLFGRVHVTSTVLRELKDLKNPALAAVREWANNPPPWLVVKDPSRLDPTLKGLQDGEISAISLAQELHANRTLLDDGDARRLAIEPERTLHDVAPAKQGEEVKHKVVGTLGILEAAAERGHIPDLSTRLDFLVDRTPFRCGKHCREIVQDMKQRDLQRKQAQEQDRKVEQQAQEPPAPQPDPAPEQKPRMRHRRGMGM